MQKLEHILAEYFAEPKSITHYCEFSDQLKMVSGDLLVVIELHPEHTKALLKEINQKKDLNMPSLSFRM